MLRTDIPGRVETGTEHEDQAIILKDSHVTVRKRTAVPNPLDLDGGGSAGIARAHEVAVHGVR